MNISGFDRDRRRANFSLSPLFSTTAVMEKKRKINHEYPAASNPTECLTQLRMCKRMTDLTIIIPGHDEHIKAHRLVLSMWSSVFEAMLFGPMAEGDTITLKEDPPQGFKWVLNYMYTGETSLPSMELALQVYLLADKYNMKHLFTVCSQSLSERVSAESVPEVFNLATLLEDKILINRCAQVLGNSLDSVFSTTSIGKLSSDSLKQLLSKDLPVSSESIVFKGVVNWCREHLESQRKEIKPNKLRKEVEKFLPEVRFLTMSLEEFVKDVLSEKILTLKEVEAIQLNIAGVPDVSIPPLFSSLKICRNKFRMSLLRECRIVIDRYRDDNVMRLAANESNLAANESNLVDSNNASFKQVTSPRILSHVKTVDTIYLEKLEYDTNIGTSGKITVKNSSGQKLQVVEFDGKVAKFGSLSFDGQDTKFLGLQMQPEETYNFYIGGAKKSVPPGTKSFIIADNGLISGKIMNNFKDPCVFHYWKHIS